MSHLSELENAVLTTLAAIQIQGRPALTTVQGFPDPDRRRATAAIARLNQPAALVIYAGRGRPDPSSANLGPPRLSVILSARHLGCGGRPRLGDDDHPGAFALLEETVRALHGMTLAGDQTLWAIDEQVVSGDGRDAVYEQRYVVEAVVGAAPTFGGAAPAGPDAHVRVIPDAIRGDRIVFAFPGIDGVYAHHAGLRGRTIRWTGRLRADDDAALSAIEAAFEALAADPTPREMVDGSGRVFRECILDTFAREGPRRRDPVTGRVMQNFEAVFEQLHASPPPG